MRFASGLSTASLAMALCLVARAHPQTTPANPIHKDPVMTHHAEGTFDVKMTPLAADDAAAGTPISRYSGVKQIPRRPGRNQPKVEMLGAGDPAKGNAGYVAMEYVTGNLHGHTGSFALQHYRHNGGWQLQALR